MPSRPPSFREIGSRKPTFRELLIPEAQYPRMSLLGSSVSRGRLVSLSALLYLLPALEDFHQCVRNIGMVVHHLPFPLFTAVDVRHPPINAYPLLSERRLATFST